MFAVCCLYISRVCVCFNIIVVIYFSACLFTLKLIFNIYIIFDCLHCQVT